MILDEIGRYVETTYSNLALRGIRVLDMQTKRYAVRKLDFNAGYEIYVVATGYSIKRTRNTHRAPVLAQCNRMNASLREAR